MDYRRWWEEGTGLEGGGRMAEEMESETEDRGGGGGVTMTKERYRSRGGELAPNYHRDGA